MQYLRLGGAVALLGVTVPPLIPLVQGTTEQALIAHDLGWLNRGNVIGTLASYIAACFLVNVVCAGARRTKQLHIRTVYWWVGATSLVVASFLITRFLITQLVDKQLGLLSAITVAALACVQVSRLQFAEYLFNPFVRGQRLTTSKAVRALRGLLPAGCFPWGADHINVKDENKHTLIMGNVGGGKSTFFACMMSMTGFRPNELWLVFDAKAELVSPLEALGKKVIILNPLDERSVAWAMDKDIVNADQVAAVSKIMFPDESAGEDNYWTEAARNLLTRLMVVFIASGKPWTLRDVLLACGDTKDLQALLSRDPKNKELVQGLTGTHKSGANDYILTLNNRLQKFHVVASLWAKAQHKIAFRDLIRSENYDNIAIVFGSDPASGPTINALNHLMFERINQLILSLPENRERRIKLWLDEVSEASRYMGNALVRFLTLARSKGGCAILGAQNISGLVDKFGKDQAKQIVGTPYHRAIVGGVDGETAEWFSKDVVGKVELIESQIGYSETFSAADREIDEGKLQKNGAREVSPSHRSKQFA